MGPLNVAYPYGYAHLEPVVYNQGQNHNAVDERSTTQQTRSRSRAGASRTDRTSRNETLAAVTVNPLSTPSPRFN